MKTIEELAKECGAYIETGENDEHLEALCKAYMQDRLKSLEPVAWRHLHEDGWEYYDDASCDDCQTIYDISSLLEKK